MIKTFYLAINLVFLNLGYAQEEDGAALSKKAQDEVLSSIQKASTELAPGGVKELPIYEFDEKNQKEEEVVKQLRARDRVSLAGSGTRNGSSSAGQGQANSRNNYFQQQIEQRRDQRDRDRKKRYHQIQDF